MTAADGHLKCGCIKFRWVN